ncbi:transcription termination factor Rho [Mycolicibacterium aurum]|uniref:Transcription termination factor Rho n=1 Tax=Mycolicibacterium aurum TaxID=1791 RepID=A0A3S4S0P4_MYCAU|nr:transcription termination factor Rho [Mycolicibacterium aurum]VEG57079.1 transcription termination factor Rho [Mycolicibacterium aurum]
MTDTDLITADGSNESSELPKSVTNVSTSAEAGAPVSAPAADDAPAAAAPARRGALTGMVLPELRALAKEIGVEGASGLRKGELIAAIRERRGESNGTSAPKAASPAPAEAPAESTDTSDKGAAGGDATAQTADAQPPQRRRERRGASREQGGPTNEPAKSEDNADATQADAGEAADRDKKSQQDPEAGGRDTRQNRDNQRNQDTRNQDNRNQDNRNQDNKADSEQDNRSDGGGQNRGGRGGDNSARDRGDNNARDRGGDNNRDRGGDNNRDRGGDNNLDDDGDGRQGRRGRRFRDRKRRDRGEGGGNAGGGQDRDTELREDDVVQPVAGILDVLDNYAFVRTSGYLAGPNDVYVSMNMVRKNGLRRGDAVTGAVRVPKDGGDNTNQRQKFNPLVRLDSVNGKPVEEAKKRPEFQKLTPLYPNQRLRLETTPDKLTTRVIDLIMPIGKGQRALIVSPPKAGKTTIMQDIANAITRNNPECHLMVVLVDERPEEVTDMQRSVKGEVIASTFDRPPSDHTQAAELAIERAKRLVEQGKDVVVLLDSITRLGRAYNNASPASGRILSGGVDSTALYPPKRFLGAARNIEEGGSLTIIATAMVETGSTGDTVIFEEFKGTGNAELKLDRKISERRVFPAVDVNPSGTRKDELLLSADEFAVVHKLRRVLSGLDPHQAIDLLMSQLRKSKNNYEFLVQVSKNTPGGNDHD